MTTTTVATPQSIVDADFDSILFQGHLEDGHLVPHGVLADKNQLDALPVGVYVMEQDGMVIACNAAAIEAWGRTPELGAAERFCGAFRLRYPSGDVMANHLAPPAVTLNNGGTVRNADVICEHPDWTRLLALVNVFPIRDAEGSAIGAVNVFRHNPGKTVPGLLAN